ncbi:MAG: metalloregulator ArsR/SmtB family transcription factor [Chloroflexota bacterium]|nr:metalloregulator ArsR/SmtB family transcription factor [Chloroflexota bacterium]
MGELVAGTPALRLSTAVSLPLDLVSVLSLLYRAVPGSDLDPWLVAARRGLPPTLRADLDLLHGFSGRLLYYMEEPVMRFDPLRPDRLDAGIGDLLAFLDGLPPEEYRRMAVSAVARVAWDLGQPAPLVPEDDPDGWRRALEPALTTASADEVLPLLAEPARLKARTIALFQGVWDVLYAAEYRAREPELRLAADLAEPATDRGFGLAFADLTGSRPPAPLIARLAEVERVAFCPSAHLGSFVSYILYPPDLVVFFGAPGLLARRGAASTTEAPIVAPSEAAERQEATEVPTEPGDLDADALLESLRALADPTRLRVLDLLNGGELYAQEIVGRLGIAQSAVSRHLAQLERAGLVAVRPRRGSKYYGLVPDRLEAVAGALRVKGGNGGPAEGL